jgi:hypothetical protein
MEQLAGAAGLAGLVGSEAWSAAMVVQVLCVGGVSARYTRFDRLSVMVGVVKNRKFIA